MLRGDRRLVMRRLSRKLGEPRRLGMEGDREPDCDDPEPLPEEELPELLFVEQLVREECDPDLELCDPLRLLDELYRDLDSLLESCR